MGNINKVSHNVWDELLKKYAFKNGLVNYKGFISEKKRLIEYTDLLSQNPPTKNWEEKERLVYWINAYNAFTILLIVNNYPLESIKDIAINIVELKSTWQLKFFKIGGSDFDLDTIEHEILRKKFNEPRIHFAINCASFSCPTLRNEAFVVSKLEEQLEDQAIHFINNQVKNLITANHAKLSNIFKSYGGDFTKNQTIFKFLEKYVPFEFSKDVSLDYLPYDWSLNEIK